jgi:hypothetical protein
MLEGRTVSGGDGNLSDILELHPPPNHLLSNNAALTHYQRRLYVDLEYKSTECEERMNNKAYILTIEDGTEVFTRLPNLSLGPPSIQQHQKLPPAHL